MLITNDLCFGLESGDSGPPASSRCALPPSLLTDSGM